MSVKFRGGYFISAGEFSGDILAAELHTYLQNQFNSCPAFGVTGPCMREAGIETILDIKELSSMGVGNIILQLPKLRMLEQRILTAILRRRPKLAILVDYPGLHFRLAEILHMHGIKVVQYVAPKLWAWGENRLARLRRDFDLVLGILPFEKSYFLKHGVSYEYIGTPPLDRISRVLVHRKEFKFGQEKICALLPGSREAEIKNLFPKFLEIISILKSRIAEISFVLPLAPNFDKHRLVSMFSNLLEDHELEKFEDENWPKEIRNIKFYRGMSLELMSLADVALVASGTATLECALLNTPMCVLYCVDSLTYSFASKLVKVNYISLVNLLAQKRVVREFIQNFDVMDVAQDLYELIGVDLQFHNRRSEMLEEFSLIKQSLTPNAAHNAAISIAKLVS